MTQSSSPPNAIQPKPVPVSVEQKVAAAPAMVAPPVAAEPERPAAPEVQARHAEMRLKELAAELDDEDDDDDGEDDNDEDLDETELEASQRLKKKFKQEADEEISDDGDDNDLKRDEEGEEKQVMQDATQRQKDGCPHNDTECIRNKAEERLKKPKKDSDQDHGWFTDSINYVSDFFGASEDGDDDDDDDKDDKLSEHEEDAMTRISHKYEKEEDKDVEELLDCEPDDEECLREKKNRERQERKHKPVPLHEDWELEAANSSISRNRSASRFRAEEEGDDNDDDWFSQSLNYVTSIFGDTSSSSSRQGEKTSSSPDNASVQGAQPGNAGASRHYQLKTLLVQSRWAQIYFMLRMLTRLALLHAHILGTTCENSTDRGVCLSINGRSMDMIPSSELDISLLASVLMAINITLLRPCPPNMLADFYRS
jgi:hypothetical protein